MTRRTLLLALATLTSAACNLPPPTTVNVDPVNGRSDVEYGALPAATQNVETGDLARDSLKPVCDVRSGKPVTDDAKLAKVLAGVGSWQKNGKKAPPKPVDPNQGPVSVTNKGVGVRIPGLAGKPHTDQDPAWFAVSCDGGKITVTLDDEPMELDALYAHDHNQSPELWLAGYSLKTKHSFLAKVSTSPRAKNVVPNTLFRVYDLSRYLLAKVDDVQVQTFDQSFRMYFVEEGKTAGVRVVGRQYGDYVAVGRFTVGAPPAAK